MKKVLGLGVIALALAFSFNAFAQTAMTTTTTTTTATAAFTRDLTVGSTGADVTALQTLLIANGKLVIAAPTGYFGSLTKAALASWQASVGITPAAGYFGPITRAYLATHSTGSTTTTTSTVPGCVAGAMFSSTTGQSCTASATTTTTTTTLSGSEADLSNFDLKSEDDVNEGDTKASVATAQFQVKDGDVRIDRVDFDFQSTGSGDSKDEPWKVFKKAYLMQDGKTIASMDVDDEDAFSDEDTTSGNDTYRLRFSDVNSIVKEDDRAEITLALDVNDSVDGAEDGDASFNVYVPDQGIRAIDGAGVDQYTGDEDDTVSFDINAAGNEDNLTFRDADDEVETQTIEVDDNDSSDWFSVLNFELESDSDSQGDIQIKKVPVTINVSGDVYADVVKDAELVIDGQTYNDFDVDTASSTGTSTVLVFDLKNDDVNISKGDTVSAALKLKFNKVSGNYAEGTSVTANITGANVDAVDAEGADDLDTDQLDGSVSGNAQTLRTAGVSVTEVDQQTSKTTGDNNTGDVGTFNLTINVTAFDQDMYIPLTAGTGTSTGVTFALYNSANSVVVSGTSSGSSLTLNSGGTRVGNYVRISSGQTAKLTVQVNYDPTVTDSYYLQLLSVNSAPSQMAPTTIQSVGPVEDYQTSPNLFLRS